MPRENFRSRARRKAHHDVRAGLDVDRRAMTEAERDALVEGVHLGAVSRFGAVKLSALRLDERALEPRRERRARVDRRRRHAHAARGASAPRAA